MASEGRLILNKLNELVKEDFETFKWFLTNDMVEGFSSIPRSKLEKAERYNVVQLMVDQYGSPGAANITVQILKQIGQSKLSSDLEKELTGKVFGDFFYLHDEQISINRPIKLLIIPFCVKVPLCM